MSISIDEMKVGDSGRVVGFDKDFMSYRQKLLAMGLTPGTQFSVIRVAPLGDPVEVRIRGIDLSLRKNEIAALKIERISDVFVVKKEDQLSQKVVVAIIGNPNCGKTTLFNGLTGSRQHVGNWAGVTVEKKTGLYRYDDKEITVADLPGIYALDVHDVTTSLDEKVAREYILSREADLIINIVDTTHLEHNLYLTAQLLEMRLPLLIVLNIMDDASGRNLKIDSEEIARRLDCPSMAIVASQAEEVDSLKSFINQLAEEPPISSSPVKYPEKILTAIQRLVPMIEKITPDKTIDPQWLAVKLLEGDSFAMSVTDEKIKSESDRLLQAIEQDCGEEADILIADSRYELTNALAEDTVIRRSNTHSGLSDTIDKVMLNRFVGIPIFFGVMYLMFTFTIKLGRVFKPFFNNLAQALFIDAPTEAMVAIGSPQWLITLLAGGIGNGIREVAAFIPILGFLYLFISILEESGYMARATFLMDRFMRVLGLPGKSFVPMILGFGCNVPAMMATRTLERQRDRTLNILLNPFMTCGARLAVFTVFAAAFFPENGQVVVFTLYLIGVATAIMTAMIMKNTFLKEEYSLSVMEIPAYHLPKLKNVLINSWIRVKAFIIRVGKIIITMVLILHILSAWSTDGSFGEENIENSVLGAAGRAMTPVFAPLGITEQNWPATVAIFTGVLHKVVVISTLKTIYTETSHQPEKAEFDLGVSIKKVFMAIPMGFNKQFGGGMANKNGENSPFSGALKNHFNGQIGAFAYLLFILLYFPCIATTATAYRETNKGWAIFMVVWATGLAYLVGTLFYQVATYSEHPGATLLWVIGSIFLVCVVVMSFHYWGKKEQRTISIRADASP
ncbi:MAG: Fe(2+) transporter permease subunit FeoB [Methylococcales bacterium]